MIVLEMLTQAAGNNPLGIWRTVVKHVIILRPVSDSMGFRRADVFFHDPQRVVRFALIHNEVLVKPNTSLQTTRKGSCSTC